MTPTPEEIKREAEKYADQHHDSEGTVVDRFSWKAAYDAFIAGCTASIASRTAEIEAIDEMLLAKAEELEIAVDFSDKTYDGDKEAPMDRIGFLEYLCQNKEASWYDHVQVLLREKAELERAPILSHDWVVANGWEMNTRGQKTLSTAELYEFYLQSKERKVHDQCVSCGCSVELGYKYCAECLCEDDSDYLNG